MPWFRLPEPRRSAPADYVAVRSALTTPSWSREPRHWVQGSHRAAVEVRSPAWSARSGWARDGVWARLLRMASAKCLVRLASCPSRPELVAAEEPVGAFAGAAGLDIGGLLAGLPASGDNDGALDGSALLAVDVLCVGESYRVEVLCAETDVPVGPGERDRYVSVFADGAHLAAGAVLDDDGRRRSVSCSRRESLSRRDHRVRASLAMRYRNVQGTLGVRKTRCAGRCPKPLSIG
jgi:hypothetical protein